MSLKDLETKRRNIVFYTLSAIVIAFLSAFGINSFNNDLIELGAFLSITAASTLINILWFLRSNNYRFAIHILSTFAMCICVVLFVFGGFENTGFLWLYPLFVIIFFISEFIISASFSVGFLIFAIVSLAIPNNPLLQANYPPEIAVRFPATLSALILILFAYEKLRIQSQEKLSNLHQQVLNAANIDILTSLHNRRYVHEVIIPNNRFPQEYDDGGCLLLVDIDYFKKINDVHGHKAGDVVLKGISKNLKSCTRQGDVVARWGGEEFLILLVGTSKEVSYKRAEAIRESIADEKFVTGEASINATVSIGLALITNNKSAEETIHLADKALYKAKESGRNRVA